MIIGNGLIARAFQASSFDFTRSVVFASGVSNSLTANESDFLREYKTIESIESCELTVIYFSTLSIYDSSRNRSSYVAHKLRTENIIKKRFTNSIILRLPEVFGETRNPNTLHSFLYQEVRKGTRENIWPVHRNIIDVEVIPAAAKNILESNKESIVTVNLACRHSYAAEYLYYCIESLVTGSEIPKPSPKDRLTLPNNGYPGVENKTVWIADDENYISSIVRKYNSFHEQR